MANQTIPRDHWDEFFAELTVRYEGWTTIVELVGEVDLDEPVERTLDLAAADLDNGEASIRLEFTDAPPIAIAEPTRVALEEMEEGHDDVLEIESATGTLRLRLRFPSTEVMEETE